MTYYKYFFKQLSPPSALHFDQQMNNLSNYNPLDAPKLIIGFIPFAQSNMQKKNYHPEKESLSISIADRHY